MNVSSVHLVCPLGCTPSIWSHMFMLWFALSWLTAISLMSSLAIWDKKTSKSKASEPAP